MRPPSLWAVNWKDGMLITEKHLSHQSRYHEELVQWLSSNLAGGYGLVANQTYRRETLEVVPELKEGTLIVTVDSCLAVTAGGYIVNINRENQAGSPPTATLPVDPMAEQTLPVYLSVEVETKKEIGEPMAGEEPPRIPYATQKYELHIGKAPNLAEGTWLQIAELNLRSNQVSLSEDYLPPCVTVSSSRRLYLAAGELRNILENLLKLTAQVFVAFSSPGEGFELQESFSTMVEQLTLFLATIIDSQPPPGPQHPSELVLRYKSLFRFFWSLFELHPEVRSFLQRSQIAEKEKSFLAEVQTFLKRDYRHEDLRSQVSSIRALLRDMEEILVFISQLGPAQFRPFAKILEYRGNEYSQLTYERCHFYREGDLHYLTIEGIKTEPLKDIIALVSKSLFSAQDYAYIDMRIGTNEAKTVGRSDPGEVDTRTIGDRIVFSLVDRLETPDVYRMTVIFRGPIDYSRFFDITPSDVQVYGF